VRVCVFVCLCVYVCVCMSVSVSESVSVYTCVCVRTGERSAVNTSPSGLADMFVGNCLS